MDIENLKSNISIYEISLEKARLNYEREKKLSDAGLSSKADFEAIEANYSQTMEQLESAKKKLLMLTTGIASSDKELSNIIYAPAGGTILSLISEKGSPVIKQNNYNEGTTLATIANMESLVFTGEITERDLSKIQIGQMVRIETSVDIKERLYGKIKRIYPRGIEEGGIVKFPIEASICNSEPIVWGGLNATAIATIDKKDSVLCIEEKYIEYEGDSAFVYIYYSNGEEKKQKIVLGISDNNKSEIISGLLMNQKIKLPDEE